MLAHLQIPETHYLECWKLQYCMFANSENVKHTHLGVPQCCMLAHLQMPDTHYWEHWKLQFACLPFRKMRNTLGETTVLHVSTLANARHPLLGILETAICMFANSENAKHTWGDHNVAC